MKRTHLTLLCAVFVLAISTAGCAKPPTEAMDKAAEAVTIAENDNNAVTYAAQSVARAKDALARMYSEADSKRYDAAGSYAAEATAAAERAINEGRAGAARARDDAANLVAQLSPLIEETGQGIEAARSAGLAIDFETVDIEFDAACLNADQAQEALSASRYQESMDRGRAARLGLNSINMQLSVAAMSETRKK